MIPAPRPQAPSRFSENCARWQKQHEDALEENASHRFCWYVIDGDSARDLLIPALRAMTEEHCSYCDGYSSWEIGESIDHFRPKSRFPKLAYQWENFFLACTNCQKRGDDFDELLLRPDDADYSFDRYFEFDYASGQLRIPSNASPEDRARAETTIRLFDLNHPDRSKARRRAFEQSLYGSARPYRFIQR